MNKPLARVLSACLLLAAGAVMLAAQDQTAQPGQPTRARVWIQNRGKTEAVPVSVQDVSADRPLPVQVTGAPTVTTSPGSVVQARVARQSWEYHDVNITTGQDPIAVLNNAGGDGWETTGLVWPSAGGTVVIMKRPK
jgi:hypothetical protein